MGKKKEVMQHTEYLTRLCRLLKEVKDIAEEIGTNDLTLVAHLLILDGIRYKQLKYFKGVEVNRGKV